MPSKRQPAKQRRAAENRAKRAALAARSGHAGLHRGMTTARSSSRSSGGSKSSATAATTPSLPVAGLGGGLAGWKEWFGFGRGAKRGAGVFAALLAVVFAVVAYVSSPFFPVSVDDRGEVVPAGPNAFRGLYLEARSYLSGTDVVAKSTTALEANGAAVLLIMAIPLLVVITAVIGFRRAGRSLPLTIGMLALAVLVLLLQFVAFLPAMVALAVSSFQVRKVEVAARVAERSAAEMSSRKEPQDEVVEDEYEEDEYDEDEYDEDEYDEDEDVDDEDSYDEDEYDTEELEDADTEDVDDEYVEDEDVEAVASNEEGEPKPRP